MMPARRGLEEFSLSFLDVICCGFGAVILLLMITKTVQPQIIEMSTVNLDGRIAALREQLFALRGESRIMNRDLNAKHEQLSRYRERIAILHGQLASVQSQHETLEAGSHSGELAKFANARQQLSDEIKRLQGLQYQNKNKLIGGIPVDSEYIIFVIDTSGSMFSNSWNRVLREFQAILRIYPGVKGIQIMNDMGQYMFSRYRGQWIPDTPGRRKAILKRLRGWNVFSNSSPVEGIAQAVRTFYAADKKISVYVFGDDFSGGSIQKAVDEIGRINRVDATGNRRVRIHAVGFPVLFSQGAPPVSAVRFANLMRQVTQHNGGTFVGLNDYR